MAHPNPSPATIASGSLAAWEYLASYVDIRSAYGTDDAAAAYHYNVQGRPVEGRTLIFDAWEYMASNVDLIDVYGIDVLSAAMHYVITGLPVEGRSWDTFDGAAYLAANADVAAWAATQSTNDEHDAAWHYVVAGRAEVTAGLRASDGQGTVVNPIPLTTGIDVLTGTGGRDVFTSTDATLNPVDNIAGLGGPDEFWYATSANATESGFFMNNVERFQATADSGSTVSFDLSGTTGVTTLASLNTTGNVAFNQVTGIADVEVNNMTTSGNVTVSFQNAVLAGGSDAVNLNLINNGNTGVGTITLGRTGDADGGIETLNIATSQAASVVNTLDADVATINITGNQGLTITNALDGNVATLNASAFTAALGLDMSNSGVDVTYTGSQAADTITFGTTANNNTINTGAGDDVLTIGSGNDTIDMGAGDDTINADPGDINVGDTISGGAGVDTINLSGADTLQLSETELMTAIENIDLAGNGSVITVHNNLVTTATGNDFEVISGTDNTTVDLRNLSVPNTVTVTDDTGGTELVWFRDQQLDGMFDLNLDIDADRTVMDARDDEVRIYDGATMTVNDTNNFSGVDIIRIKADSSTAQTYNLNLSDALVQQTTAHMEDVPFIGTNAILGDGVDDARLTIRVDSDVPVGSVINIDTTGMTLNANVTVISGSNVTVNVTGPAVNLVQLLEYTLNADNLTGTAGDDTFVADFLAEVQAADSINGLGQTTGDTLQLNFAVNNAGVALVGTQLNATGIAGIENIVFNTNNAVSFADDTVAGNSTTGVVAFTTGGGNDTIVGNINIGNTYNMGGGNDTYTSAGVISEMVNGGAGADTFNFGTITHYAAGDVITGGADTDTLNVTNGGAGVVAALHTPGGPTLSGVDIMNLTVNTNAANGFTLNTAGVQQSDAGNAITVNVNDANTAANTVAIFNAGGVVAGNSVNVTMVTTADAGQVGDAADIITGAGDDSITLSVGVTGYAVQGNAGADAIDISGAGAGGAMVRFVSANDGGNQGANTGFDTITGFVSGTDELGFLAAGFAPTDTAGTGVGNMVRATDAAANFTTTHNALVMTQAGAGMTDADLLNLTQVVANANVMGVTAAATQGGFIVANGQTQSAVYLYIEQDGTVNNIATSELKFLGLVDGDNTLGAGATDLQYV